jgi:cysteine desulfurase
VRTTAIPERIYLDHAATSPLRPEAKAAMEEGFRLWANPSSPHAEGRRARAALEDARERIKRALGLGQGDKNYELIFTSGASEALWIALNRAKAKRRIVSAVEHDAVFRAAPDAEVVPIPLFGAEPDGETFSTALRTGGSIFALQSLNSETGTQLLHARSEHSLGLVQQVRGAGGMLLADCSQSAGKFALPEADMIVVSAHKFGGPIGIGALLVRDFAMLEPGGGHERGYRQGTENLPGALGMAAALEAGGLESWGTTEAERLDFRQAIWGAGEGLVMGPQCSHIFAVAHPTMSAQALLIRLDAMGFAVSAGSACSSGTLKKSRVLDAFGVPDDVAARTIRVSLGWSTTPEELERFSEAWASLC